MTIRRQAATPRADPSTFRYSATRRLRPPEPAPDKRFADKLHTPSASGRLRRAAFAIHEGAVGFAIGE